MPQRTTPLLQQPTAARLSEAARLNKHGVLRAGVRHTPLPCPAPSRPPATCLQEALPRLQVLRHRQIPLAGAHLLGGAPPLDQQPAVGAEHPHVDGAVQQACSGN